MRRVCPAVVLLLASVAGEGAAQMQTEVTVKVPVNVTQLAPEVSKVKVGCVMTSEAIQTPNHDKVMIEEIPVMQGKVVTTVSLIFALLLENPTGKSATLKCLFTGWSDKDGWSPMAENSSNPTFRVKPTLGQMEHSFVW